MNIKKIVHHICFGFIAFYGVSFAEISAAFSDTASPIKTLFNIPSVATFLMGMAIFLIATAKIIAYDHISTLRSEGSIFWKKEYSKPAACGFAVLLACCAVFYFVQNMVVISDGNPASAEELAEMQTGATNLLVLFFGAFFLWMIFLKNLILDRHCDWIKTILNFVRTDVSVYLIFRAAVFLLSLGGALLMGSRSGAVQNSYFLFTLDDEQVQAIATGSLSGRGSFFSGVTEAASFMVLIHMAEELLSGANRYKPGERFRRMFLETDTVKLLVMTLICIVTGLVSAGDKMNLLTLLINTVMIGLWLISTLLFIADTTVLPYVIIYASLGFIEGILPFPEGSGALALTYPLIIAARILLFSVVAVMIAHYEIRRKRAMQQTSTGRPTFSYRLWNTTFMDLLVLILRLGELGLRAFSKKAPATAEEKDLLQLAAWARKGNDYIDNAIEKITRSVVSK